MPFKNISKLEEMLREDLTNMTQRRINLLQQRDQIDGMINELTTSIDRYAAQLVEEAETNGEVENKVAKRF